MASVLQALLKTQLIVHLVHLVSFAKRVHNRSVRRRVLTDKYWMDFALPGRQKTQCSALRARQVRSAQEEWQLRARPLATMARSSGAHARRDLALIQPRVIFVRQAFIARMV